MQPTRLRARLMPALGGPSGEIVRPTIARARRDTGGSLAVLLLLLAPLIADAQHDRKVPRIGILWAHSPSGVSPFAEAFREAEGSFDRLPSLAAERADRVIK